MSPFIRQVNTPITNRQLEPLDSRCKVVQFDEPLTASDFHKLAEFLKNYPDVKLRVYGHNSVESLNFLQLFPFLKRFQVDVWKIKSFQGIKFLPEDLVSLSIGATKSKAHSLKFLTSFRQLEELYIEGHTKHIEAIGELRRLEKLTLRSITMPNLEFLLPLESLWWLALKLGGTKDLSLLRKIGQLKYLELWMIRGLTDLNPISEVSTLQYVFLQALKQVKQLPKLKDLVHLRRLHLETMKGLQDIAPIMEAPVLEELLISGVSNVSPEDLRHLQNHLSLKQVWVGFGSRKKNNLAKQALEQLEASEGYSKWHFDFI